MFIHCLRRQENLLWYDLDESRHSSCKDVSWVLICRFPQSHLCLVEGGGLERRRSIDKTMRATAAVLGYFGLGA
jgi:hypothetical protein